MDRWKGFAAVLCQSMSKWTTSKDKVESRSLSEKAKGAMNQKANGIKRRKSPSTDYSSFHPTNSAATACHHQIPDCD
jgi:hypothetical protein